MSSNEKANLLTVLSRGHARVESISELRWWLEIVMISREALLISRETARALTDYVFEKFA